MARTLKSKSVSYGLVEIVENQGAFGYRYSLQVNGEVKAQTDDLGFIQSEFEKRY